MAIDLTATSQLLVVAPRASLNPLVQCFCTAGLTEKLLVRVRVSLEKPAPTAHRSLITDN